MQQNVIAPVGAALPVGDTVAGAQLPPLGVGFTYSPDVSKLVPHPGLGPSVVT